MACSIGQAGLHHGYGLGTKLPWPKSPLPSLVCSYVEAVLQPIADAIAGALRPDTQVWVTMQGEMGVSLGRPASQLGRWQQR